MANRKSPFFVSILTPSPGGKYWGRYPNGDRPGGGAALDAAATDTVTVAAAVATQIRLAGGAAAMAAAAVAFSVSTAPFILYTNTNAGPVSGGENNKGCYLFIYGWNLDVFANYGVTNFVTIGGVAVDNYRYLKPAVGPVGTSLGIQCLAVQVGALSGLSLGTNYPIKVTVGGVDPGNAISGGHYLDMNGNALDFMPNPGGIKFVSLTGNDTNSGDWGSPYRHLQAFPSGFTGAIWGPSSAAANTTSNNIPPGTHVYILEGDYGADRTFGNRWCDFFGRTGTPPTGAVNSGPIVISHYPGAAGANDPDVVQYLGTTGAAGGFNGADTARAGGWPTSDQWTPPWTGAGIGYSKWIHLSNMQVRIPPGATGDAAPFNLQTGADFWRIINCEAEWRCNTGSPTAAGIAGEGSNILRLGNYIHDIYDPSGSLQNHAIYIGSNYGQNLPTNRPSGCAEYHGVTAFNYIENILGGSGIQSRGPDTGQGAAADSSPWPSFHHNVIDGTGKHGFNMFDWRGRVDIWANLIMHVAQSPFFTNSDNVTVASGIYFGFNTSYDWGSSTFYPAVYSNGGSSTGSVRVESSVFYQVTRGSSPSFDRFYTSTNGCAHVFDKNTWYDVNNTSATVPTGDAAQANPLFTNAATEDFTPQSGSPLLNAGETPATSAVPTTRDLFGRVRPQGVATKWAVGACERVGG